MTIIKWDPFQNVASLQDRINRLFSEAFPAGAESDALAPTVWQPLVDILETESAVVIQAELPDVDREAIAVDLTDNVLTISGERPQRPERPSERYVRRERHYGVFQRAFTLATPVAPESIKARFKNGVLEIQIPKTDEPRPRRISID